MARTWADPRGGAADVIASAGEPRLAAYALAGSALSVMATVGAQSLNPAPGPAADMAGWLSAQLVAGLFVRTLALYAVAVLLGLACRAFGGTGSGRPTRAALFWSGLVAAPAAVALTLIGAALTGLAGAPGWAAEGGQALGSLVWAVLLAPALAEAHGFRSARGVYAGFAALALALAATTFLL
jgi:hypothetical protein